MSRFRPSYIRLYETGVLAERIEALGRLMEGCHLCPRRCMVRRDKGVLGVCRTGPKPVVSSYSPHFGEEPPLVGSRGSGTIFMTYCNLACTFCQNYEISHLGMGKEVTTDELSDMMIDLWKSGCHNINFVTPTHQAAAIVASLPKAIEAGLDIPLVYNTGGYDSVSTLRLLDNIFDIYMPDLKYGGNPEALALSSAPSYVEVSREAAIEMHRQVGELRLDPDGIAEKGLIIRHLVLPGGYAKSRQVIDFIANELSIATYVNIMDQYRPCYKAGEDENFPELKRRITTSEFEEVVDMARAAGLTRIAGITA